MGVIYPVKKMFLATFLEQVFAYFLFSLCSDPGMNVRARWKNSHLLRLRSLHQRRMPGRLCEEPTSLHLQKWKQVRWSGSAQPFKQQPDLSWSESGLSSRCLISAFPGFSTAHSTESAANLLPKRGPEPLEYIPLGRKRCHQEQEKAESHPKRVKQSESSSSGSTDGFTYMGKDVACLLEIHKIKCNFCFVLLVCIFII